MKRAREDARGKPRGERLRPERREERRRIVHQAQLAEVTRIGEVQRGAAVEDERRAQEARRRRVGRPHMEIAGEAQVQHEHTAVGAEQEMLGAALDVEDASAGEGPCEGRRVGLPHRAGRQQLHRTHGPSEHGWLRGRTDAQAAGDGLDLGKLRHSVLLASRRCGGNSIVLGGGSPPPPR